MSSCLINGLIKLELPEGVFLNIFAKGKLMANRYGEGTIIFHNSRQINREAVVGIDLLSDETAVLEVAIKDVPHVFLGDLGWLVHLRL